MSVFQYMIIMAKEFTLTLRKVGFFFTFIILTRIRVETVRKADRRALSKESGDSTLSQFNMFLQMFCS